MPKENPKSNSANRIRMKAPHYLAGEILREYAGQPKTFTIGYSYLTIRPGDYVSEINSEQFVNARFIKNNPSLWERV